MRQEEPFDLLMCVHLLVFWCLVLVDTGFPLPVDFYEPSYDTPIHFLRLRANFSKHKSV